MHAVFDHSYNSIHDGVSSSCEGSSICIAERLPELRQYRLPQPAAKEPRQAVALLLQAFAGFQAANHFTPGNFSLRVFMSSQHAKAFGI